jgi:molybdopterin-guanine dinucleotide biosynthesis protein
MDILSKLRENNVKILSIIGLSKNCGKTTTLIKLIEKLEGENLKICITSIGIDGEKFDHLFLFEKPLIYLKKNFYVITSENSLKDSSIEYKILKRFNIKTPKGELLLLRVEKEGNVEVSGPYIGKDLEYILSQIKDYSFDLIIIDGAIDRKISIKYSDGLILQTGLNIMDEKIDIIDETLFYKEIFSLNEIKDDLKKIIESKKENFKFLYIKDENSFLSNELRNLDCDFLYINGALTDSILKEVISKNIKNIIVEHPYNILISRKSFKDFLKIDGKIFVLKKVNLIGISFSTFNQEKIFDKKDEEYIYNSLKEKLKPITLFDPIKGD